MSGCRSRSRISSPPRSASARPFSVRSTSTHPVNRFFAFQSLSPWRNRTRRKDMSMTLSAGQVSSDRASVGRPQVLERGEISGRLAAGQPPGPLTADRLGETELKDRVERGVGGIEYDAEEPVELRHRHRMQRKAPDQVDVSGPVD